MLNHSLLKRIVGVAGTIVGLLLMPQSVQAATVTPEPPLSQPVITDTVQIRQVAVQPQQVPGPIGDIIKWIINATVYFPAKTFQEAVEKATTSIFSAQMNKLRDPLQRVIEVYAFKGSAIFGDRGIPAEVQAIGNRLTDAAIPIWMLSLSLLGLAVLTRNAVGLGYGTADLAGEFARWLFITLASGNAVGIVNAVHKGFNGLALAVAEGAISNGPAGFARIFIPDTGVASAWPLLLLVAGTLIGFVLIIVLSVTYIVRYVLLLAITGLAPLAIAFEGIPFTRFVFRDWLSMFLRLEILQVLNVVVLVVFKAAGLYAAPNNRDVFSAVLAITTMIGLASALIGLNLSVFKQVFGVAIDVAAQIKTAAEQTGRAIATVATMAATAGSSAPAAGLAGAAGSAANNNADGSSNRDAVASANAHDNTANFASVMGALANATGNPILRGMADGARAGAQAQNRQSATLRLADRQRELDAQRNERIARDAGASNADDVEAIAKSINQPPAGITGEQMTRAYRDIGPALRNRSQQLGGNARAAAAMGEGNFRSYGDLAAALATERARLNAGQTVEASAQPTAQPSQTTQQNTSTQTDGNPVSAATSTPAAIASQAKVAPSDLPGLRDPGGLPNGAPSAAANSTRSGSHSATPVTANQPNQNAATPQGTSTPTQPPASRPTPDTATLPTPTQTPSSPPTLDTSTPSAADWIATMRDAPMQHWAKHAPKATDPGSDGVTEHDWGVGLKLSHHTGADPARASLWGEMAADLRRTPEYGQRYVGELVSLVESHTMSERELMDVVDRRLNQDESAGNTPLRQVRRFWRASALPEENNTKR